MVMLPLSMKMSATTAAWGSAIGSWKNVFEGRREKTKYGFKKPPNALSRVIT